MKDKFLRQKLSESTQLPLTLFTTFNKIKGILAEVEHLDEKEKASLMQEAVKKSNMLKLSKCGKLLKRRIPFNIKTVDLNKMDECTVYVENFPENLSL